MDSAINRRLKLNNSKPLQAIKILYLNYVSVGKTQILWDVTPYPLLNSYLRF